MAWEKWRPCCVWRVGASAEGAAGRGNREHLKAAWRGRHRGPARQTGGVAGWHCAVALADGARLQPAPRSSISSGGGNRRRPMTLAARGITEIVDQPACVMTPAEALEASTGWLSFKLNIFPVYGASSAKALSRRSSRSSGLHHCWESAHQQARRRGGSRAMNVDCGLISYGRRARLPDRRMSPAHAGARPGCPVRTEEAFAIVVGDRSARPVTRISAVDKAVSHLPSRSEMLARHLHHRRRPKPWRCA